MLDTAPGCAFLYSEKDMLMNRRRVLVFAAAVLGGTQGPSMFAASKTDSEAHPLLGKRAPHFSTPDSTGRKRQLSDYEGKPIVFEWSSPSCPFVRAQYQGGVMAETQKWATSQGVNWLTILSAHPSRRDYVPPERADSFNKNRGAASTALLIDSDGTLGRGYGAIVTPHMFVADSQGVIVYAGAPTDKSTTDPKQVKASRNLIRAALEDLLAGRTVATAYSRPFGCTIAYSG